jgi:flagellar basal-body rod protein FlgB
MQSEEPNMQISGIFSLASQQAKWLEVRQQTIAENIANANVPGYSAKDIKPFKAILGGSNPPMAQTNPRHMASPAAANGTELLKIETSAAGDSLPVEVEAELLKTTEVRNQYELNTLIVKSFNRMILSAVKA